MPQLITPGKIVTKDGEFFVHVVIDLNINVNGGGVTISTNKTGKVDETKENDETEWEVPEFGPAPKVKFGKIEDK